MAEISPDLYIFRQLGEKTMLQSISKAGHLVHLERPCVYNHLLKEFLASVTATETPKE
jgi:pimeloyl-ACP methyl ester carboxylesterase